MNYRSLADLAQCMRSQLFKVPREVDLVVGVPRSGMLAANMLALQLNIQACDVESFLRDDKLLHGHTRQTAHPDLCLPSQARCVLVIDDSVDTGTSMERVRLRMRNLRRSSKILFGAVYVTSEAKAAVDIYFECVQKPRIFEWNVMHRPSLRHCCLDIDGVLCVDPTDRENDDGPGYERFLSSAKPLALPSYFVGHIVTSRLEKYRAHTESWLKANAISFGALHMLDLPDAKSRRTLGNHARHKAAVYRRLADTYLFIESNPDQAGEIARLSGKSVLCHETQQLYEPGLSYVFIQRKARNLGRRIIRRLGQVLARTT